MVSMTLAVCGLVALLWYILLPRPESQTYPVLLLIGGVNEESSSSTDTILFYNPETGTSGSWAYRLLESREHAAAAVYNGTMMVVGGSGSAGPIRKSEFFAKDGFVPGPAMNEARSGPATAMKGSVFPPTYVCIRYQKISYLVVM